MNVTLYSDTGNTIGEIASHKAGIFKVGNIIECGWCIIRSAGGGNYRKWIPRRIHRGNLELHIERKRTTS